MNSAHVTQRQRLQFVTGAGLVDYVLLLSLALIPVGAAADTVFKCKDATGQFKYQATKCAQQEEVSSWAAKAYQAPKVAESKEVAYSLVLTAGMTGHYRLDAEVDSTSTAFLVDTGATKVTLTEATANSAGIRCRGAHPLITAAATVMACDATISKLTFGKFVIRNVPALVLPNAQFNLMGMNVLSQFKIEQGKGKMTISMQN